MVDLASLVSSLARQQQPPPDPNGPGGPAPDPRSFGSLNIPSQPPLDVGFNPQQRQQQQTDSQDTGDQTGDGTDTGDGTSAPFDPFHVSSYMPPSPNRSGGELGKPGYEIKSALSYPGPTPGPEVPSMHEAPMVLQNASAQLGIWGSHDVAEGSRQVSSMMGGLMPFLNLLSGGAFGKNYGAAQSRKIQTQLAEARLRLQNIVDQATIVRLKHEDQLTQYGSILAEAETGVITPQEAEQRLWAAAQATGHTSLEDAIKNGGLPKAIQLLRLEDKAYRMSHQAETAMRKGLADDGEGAVLRSWNDPEAPTATGGDDIESQMFPGKAAGEATAGATAAPAQTLLPPPAPDSFDEQLQKTHNASPDEIRAAHLKFNERPLGQPEPPAESKPSRKIGAMLRELDAKFSALADPKNTKDMTPQQRIEEMKKIDPDMGQTIDDLYNYRTDLNGEKVPNNYRSHLEHLVSQLSNNTWDPTNFKSAEKFTQDKSHRQLVEREALAAQNYLLFLRAINKLNNEGKSIPANELHKWFQGDISGAGDFQELAGITRDLSIDLAAIQSLGGTPRIAIFNALLENTKDTQSPQSLRRAAQNSMTGVFAVMQSDQQSWQQLGRHDLQPGMSPSTYRIMRDITLMNPYTQQFPEGVSPEVMAVNRNDPKKWDRNLKDEQRRTPLSLKQIRAARQFVHDHANDADPEMRNQAQFWATQVGPMIGIENMVPGVDDAGQ